MTAGWVEWIMGIDAVSRPGCRVTTFCLPCTEVPLQTIDPPDTAKAAAELAKQWGQLALVAQKLLSSSNSSTNSFVLAALLLGFRAPSSLPPSASPLIHLAEALLSICEARNFSDIAHWCHLLARRSDLATQVVVTPRLTPSLRHSSLKPRAAFRASSPTPSGLLRSALTRIP